MTNYKGGKRKIIVGNVETAVPHGAVIKYLTDEVALSTSPDSMQTAAIAYVVATGKKFRLLGMVLYSDNTGTVGDLTISSGDTEDAETATKVLIEKGTNTQRFRMEIHTDVEFDAGKYIVNNPATANIEFISMVGYEY